MQNKNNMQKLRALSVAMIIALLVGGEVFAGSGKLHNGKFDLSISIRSNAPAATLNSLQNHFQHASELLFDATDGQHQFGNIRVCNDSRGGRTADIWLLPTGSPSGCSNGIDDDGDGQTDEEFSNGLDDDGDGLVDEDIGCIRSHVSGKLPQLEKTGTRIVLFEDEVSATSPHADARHIIVHEFGHYGYGIYDEYSGPSGRSNIVSVVDPNSQDASLMENFWQRPISEFSVPSNHDPDGDTWQSAQNPGESDWDTMVKNFPSLIAPSGLPSKGPTTGAGTINWVLLEPETRVVLVLDRSGSMNSPSSKIANAKAGAKIFTDLALAGDQLGIVSFADTPSVDFALTQVTNATKNSAKVAVDNIIAGGSTNIGGGLRAALNQIVGAGSPACQQVIVLLSDGVHNTGENPTAVLADLKNAGVIVHTIGLGADADTALLSNIAKETNGKFTFAASQASLQKAFTTLFTESTDNGGQITSALAPMINGEVIEHKVFIDALTPDASFLVTWPGVADLNLTLVRPDGTVITPSTAAADPSITFISETNHELYNVTSSQVGEWTIRVQAASTSGQVIATLQVLGVSSDIAFTAAANKEAVTFPEPILIEASPVAPMSVVGAIIQGTVTKPDGSSISITLYDDGAATHGDVFANDGVYANFFSSYNLNGVYAFELIATNSEGFLYTGEELFAFPELGIIPPEGASSVPAPVFTRTTGFSVIVSNVPPNVAPDLIVQDIVATENNIQVVIKNQGNVPVPPEHDFWVDVYINPDTLPTAVNDVWEFMGNEGLVWGVVAPAVPMQPGDTVTLSIGDGYYWPSLSNFSGSIPPGTPIYAQIDSANSESTYGGVLEDHEVTGGMYNNIFGPVLSQLPTSGAGSPDATIYLPLIISSNAMATTASTMSASAEPVSAEETLPVRP